MKRAYHLGLGRVSFGVNLHHCVYLKLFVEFRIAAVLVNEALFSASLLLTPLPDYNDWHLLCYLNVDRLNQQVNREILSKLFDHSLIIIFIKSLP